MKETYHIDPMGRVMIPSHVRKQMNLEPGSRVTIDVEGRSIRIRVAQDRCFVCGKPFKNPNDAITVNGNDEMKICTACAEKVEEELKKRGGQYGND